MERARLWLAIGAAAGLAAAAASLLSAPGVVGALPDDAIASVNGTILRRQSYERLLAALANDRREPLGDADRRRVLDRLIEEELLVQHAVDLGLVHTDRRVRGDLVSAVLAMVTAAADAYDPDDEELEAFYADNADYFARPMRLHVQEVFVATSATALERARAASARLRAGESIATVRRELGDSPVAPLPDAPLPPAKIREYLGPQPLRVAMELAPGATSDPIATPQGYLVLKLVVRDDAFAPPLDEVREHVRNEMRRRRGDELLRERLDELRAGADLTLARDVP